MYNLYNYSVYTFLIYLKPIYLALWYKIYITLAYMMYVPGLNLKRLQTNRNIVQMITDENAAVGNIFF